MSDTTGEGTALTVPDHIEAVGVGDEMTSPTSKRSTSPAFQFYPKDYLSSSKVQRMSMSERGVYTTLLSHCWLDNGLPINLSELARMVGMNPKQFERMWTAGPLNECFYEKGGKFQNRRLDVEHKVQADYRAKKKAAADARWTMQNECAASSVHYAELMQTDAPLPLPLSSSSIERNTHTLRFERFWAVYPKKRSKDAAFKAWLKRKPDEQFTQSIIAAVQRQRSLPDWVKDHGQFIPYPASWLNAGGWQDEDFQSHPVIAPGPKPIDEAHRKYGNMRFGK